MAGTNDHHRHYFGRKLGRMSSIAQVDNRWHDHARQHLIRSCSKTQAVVAKSSGESELYGIVRASTEGLGMVTLLGDFGMKDATVSIGIDATAAMGIAQRVGLNKVRHMEVDILWIQEQQARKILLLRKIPGIQNPSDLCTKNVPAALAERYL